MRSLIRFVVALAVVVLLVPLGTFGAPAGGEAGGWPRTRETPAGKLSVYQPEIDSWDGKVLRAHSAAAVVAPGSDRALFGMLEIEAHGRVDEKARTVSFGDVRIVKATFPSAPAREEELRAAFQGLAPAVPATLPLDRIERAAAASSAARTARAQPLRNSPPEFVFSESAAVLVLIDGPATWRPVEGFPLERVINTRALVLRERSGRVLVHVLDGWMSASGLSGPWTVATDVPAGADQVAETLGSAGEADLLTGPAGEADSEERPTLEDGAPRVVVADRPTELVVTEGKPQWAPITGTQLLYVRNTTANVFEHVGEQAVYVLASGRWFRAPSLVGPWSFVPSSRLPPDFARIPDTSPKENVKAAVAGTPQAREAVIASEVPRTARVARNASFQPQIAGKPDLKPIEGTELSYVANATVPLIRVSPTEWYAVQDGVWFTAAALEGPWKVADAVPPAIYGIPPSSPVYEATYVKVYDSDDESVVDGYTQGYLGTVVAPGPVAVYGTGYWYNPWIGPNWWVGYPWTYGFAVGVGWTPWFGWGFGFGFGWGWGAVGFGPWWGFGVAPWWAGFPWCHRFFGPVFAHPGPVFARPGPFVHPAPVPPGARPAPVAPGARPAPGAPGAPVTPGARPYVARAVPWGPRAWASTRTNVYGRWGSVASPTGALAHAGSAVARPSYGMIAHAYNSRTGGLAAGQRAPSWGGGAAYGGARAPTYAPQRAYGYSRAPGYANAPHRSSPSYGGYRGYAYPTYRGGGSWGGGGMPHGSFGAPHAAAPGGGFHGGFHGGGFHGGGGMGGFHGGGGMHR
jgi:hypothetical protein